MSCVGEINWELNCFYKEAGTMIYGFICIILPA